MNDVVFLFGIYVKKKLNQWYENQYIAQLKRI